MTNITAVTVEGKHGPEPPEFNLRMSQTNFSLKTSDKRMRAIDFHSRRGSWKLWKTEFQINSYHAMSSEKSFTKNIDKIMAYDQVETFQVTISETKYASGNMA